MLRIWDELRMTLDAYKVLYKGANTFGERIQLEAQQNRNTLKEELE